MNILDVTVKSPEDLENIGVSLIDGFNFYTPG
jgi:hypothetical protein